MSAIITIIDVVFVVTFNAVFAVGLFAALSIAVINILVFNLLEDNKGLGLQIGRKTCHR